MAKTKNKHGHRYTEPYPRTLPPLSPTPPYSPHLNDPIPVQPLDPLPVGLRHPLVYETHPVSQCLLQRRLLDRLHHRPYLLLRYCKEAVRLTLCRSVGDHVDCRQLALLARGHEHDRRLVVRC